MPKASLLARVMGATHTSQSANRLQAEAPAREAINGSPVLFGGAQNTHKVFQSRQKVLGGRFSPRLATRPEQSGAMFGLDARLAMMIFAIMATVAGYVAFGRISMARNAALIGEIDAMSDALKSYQVDMGTFFLFTLDKPVDDESSLEDISALWDKSRVKPGFRNRWHGPYTTFETRKHRTYGNWSVFYAQGDRKNYCTTDSDCFIWLSLGNVPADKWTEINAWYDEAGGREKEQRGENISRGRIQADAATNPRTLLIRTIERPI